MTKGISTQLATGLPAEWSPLSTWDVDWRASAPRALTADLRALHQDLGGLGNLSVQEQMLAERVAFQRRRLIEHENAVLNGIPPLMTPGEYSNACNTLVGLLKALGLKRRAKPAESLQSLIARTTAQDQTGGADVP